MLFFILLSCIINCNSYILYTSNNLYSKNNIKVKSHLSSTLSSNNNLLTFQDSDRLAYMDEFSGNQINKYYIPKELLNLTSKEHWDWWKHRKITESMLKNAICNGETNKLQYYFNGYKKNLLYEKAEILNLNQKYFQALGNGDLNVLQAIWKDSTASILLLANMKSEAECIGSYSTILSHLAKVTPPPSTYALKDINLMFYGDTALVTCMVDSYEKNANTKLTSNSNKASKNKLQYSVYCTNVFTKVKGSDNYVLVCNINTNVNLKDKKESAKLKKTYMDPSRTSAVKKKSPILSSGFGGKLSQVFSIGRVDLDDEDGDDNDEEDNDDDDEDSDEIIIKDISNRNNNNDDDEYDENSKEQDDNDDKKERLKMLRATIQNTLNNIIKNKKNGISTSGVIVIPTGNGSKVKSKSQSKKNNIRSYVDNDDNNNDDNNNDDNSDDDDDDDDDDEDDELIKELASRTLECINWLYNNNRLSNEEKKFINSNIIENLSSSEYSQIEAAYALLIMGSKPPTQKNNINVDEMIELSLINTDDMNDFEDFCHTYYQLACMPDL